MSTAIIGYIRLSMGLYRAEMMNLNMTMEHYGDRDVEDCLASVVFC